MEQWLLLDGITLEGADVPMGHIENPPTVEPNKADPASALSDQTAMSTGHAAEGVLLQPLIE
jgi:hypothetical protein